MKIEIKSLCIYFSKREVIHNLSYCFNKPGLYFILGKSGCGKTSLINACNELIPYRGEILFDGNNISLMKSETQSKFKNQNIGLIFQDFKLFSFLNVYENVSLSFSSYKDGQVKKQKIFDALEFVNLNHFDEKQVDQLSGGEKQRVAIARAIVHNPKYLFADEPTGSLDYQNSEEIMAILKKYSQDNIVIVVSHDEALAKKYGDELIFLKNGKIDKVKRKRKSISKDSHLLTSRIKKDSLSNRLTFSFFKKCSHAKQKKHKLRNFIIKSATSLGLFGVGLSLSISLFLKGTIKNNYAQILSDNEIIMSSANTTNEGISSSIPYHEAKQRKENYQEYIKDVGVSYINDFSSMFKDENCFYIPSNGKKEIIEDIDIQHINDFIWLDNHTNLNILPAIPLKLENDEIVVSLTNKQIKKICFYLSINRSIDSLNSFLKSNELYFCLSLKNYNWQYEDEHIFKVKGFFLDYKSAIYHTNHLFNEYVFEQLLMFPSSYEIGKTHFYPWTLLKTCYYEIYNKLDEFLYLSGDDEDFIDTYFEINSPFYFPLLSSNKYLNFYNRFILLKREEKSLRNQHLSYIKSLDSNIENAYFCPGQAYCAFPSLLMKGFINETYFSFNKELIENVQEIKSKIKSDAGEIELKKGILKGHYTCLKTNGVFFKNLKKSSIGRMPNYYDEIVVSKGFLEKIGFPQDKIMNDNLYITNIRKKTFLDDGYTLNEFVTSSLKVVGITDSSLIEIYHHPSWLINFFLTRFHISILDLKINSFIIEVNNSKNLKSVKDSLKKAFPTFDITCPILEINNSVNKIVFYLELAIAFFSFVALIVSAFLFSITMKIYLYENEKDILTLRLLSFSRKECIKMLIFYFLELSSASFIYASIELTFFSIIFCFLNSLNLLSMINFTSYFVMFFISIFLVCIGALPLFIKIKSKNN